MDTPATWRPLIERILREYAAIPYAHGEMITLPVFDRDGDHYLLMVQGRDQGKRVHGCLVHVDIIDGKIWVQRDGTESGIAVELVEAGVPRERIVLAFHAPEDRTYSGFAAA